jgi:iron complex transport system permease protein
VTVLTPRRVAVVLLAMLLVLLAAAFVGLVAGPSALAPGDVAAVLRGADSTSAAADIVLRIRLPRVVLGVLVGASLAVSGVLFQALLRNPLADPFVLGISGGAALGAILVLSLGGAVGLGYGAVPPAAFAGSVCATLLLYAVAGIRGRVSVQRLRIGGHRVPGFDLGSDGGRGHLPVADRKSRGEPRGRGGLGRRVSRGGTRLRGSPGSEPQPADAGRGVRAAARGRRRAAEADPAAGDVADGRSGRLGGGAHRLRGPHHSPPAAPAARARPPAPGFLVVCDAAARTLLGGRELPVGAITALAGGPLFLYLLRRHQLRAFAP